MLTWCHFEELAHFWRFCFDHWQLSHFSWGLRKRQVQLHHLPLGQSSPQCSPSSLPQAGDPSCMLGRMAGLESPGLSPDRTERQVLMLGKATLRAESGAPHCRSELNPRKQDSRGVWGRATFQTEADPSPTMKALVCVCHEHRRSC